MNNYHKNKSLLKVHEEYIRFLDMHIDNTSESDFEKIAVIVNNYINKLPKKCREVLVLSKKSGLTNIEISEVLNISVKTVESHISNAFKYLRSNIPDNI